MPLHYPEGRNNPEMFCHTRGPQVIAQRVEGGGVEVMRMLSRKDLPCCWERPIRQRSVSSFKNKTHTAKGLVIWPNAEHHLWSILPPFYHQPRLLSGWHFSSTFSCAQSCFLCSQASLNPWETLLSILRTELLQVTLFSFSHTHWHVKCVSQLSLHWCWITNNPPTLSDL